VRRARQATGRTDWDVYSRFKHCEDVGRTHGSRQRGRSNVDVWLPRERSKHGSSVLAGGPSVATPNGGSGLLVGSLPSRPFLLGGLLQLYTVRL
jgi:hypothetical protein